MRKSLWRPFIIALGLFSVVMLTAFALAQVTDTEVDSTTQPSADQPVITQPNTTEPATTQPDATQPAETQPDVTQPAETEPGATAPAGPGAGPAEAPAGTITVPEGEPCPPGYTPSETQPAPTAQPTQPMEPVIIEEETVVEEEVIETPAAPAGAGAGPMDTDRQQMRTTGVRQRTYYTGTRMRAGYGAGPYYMPAAGVDFDSLAALGSVLLGAGLAIKRKNR